MKRTTFFNFTLVVLTLLHGLFMSELTYAGLREALPEIERGEDQTILLDELIIRGDLGGETGEDSDESTFSKEVSEEKNESSETFKRPIERPALSTVLSWKGKENIELDIPKEILEQLTQPDLSYILEREAMQEDGD